MEIYYRRDTGLEGLFSRMQSEEEDIVVKPITDYDIDGDNPTLPSQPVAGSWGYISGDINEQEDLIKKLQDLKIEIEQEFIGQGSQVFKFKGKLSSIEELPAAASVGDVYKVGQNAYYIFDGSVWDTLSEATDNYVTIDTFNAYKDTIDNIINQLNTSIQTQIQQEIINRTQAIEELNNKKVDITTYNSFLQENAGNLETLNLQLEDLNNKIAETKTQNAEVLVLYEGSDTDFMNKEKDFQVTGLVTTPTSIKGNSITLNPINLSASSISLTAANDIIVKNSNMDGLLPKKVSDFIVGIHSDEYISIRNCILTPESAYNGIEIGKNLGLAKSILIDNVTFDGHFINNAINIYSMATNGVITISNCYFKDVFNVLRISNRANTAWTINIINCICEKWTTGEYAGLIMLQDDTSTSAEEADSNDQFSKLIINLQNITKPDGTKLEPPQNLQDICGTQNDKQIIYIWDEYRGHVAYGDKYPNISIK